MNRLGLLTIAAVCIPFWSAVGCALVHAQTMPPMRYQHAPDGPVLTIYLPWRELTVECGRLDTIGCERPNAIPGGPTVIILPEPCEWARASGERYSILACHEEAHVNHWPMDHPK